MATWNDSVSPRAASSHAPLWLPAGEVIRTRSVDGTTQATAFPARAAAACVTVPAAVATVSSRKTTSKAV